MAAAGSGSSSSGTSHLTIDHADAHPAPVNESAIVHLKAVPSSSTAASNPAQRKVLFIYTGGTLGMKPRDDGIIFN